MSIIYYWSSVVGSKQLLDKYSSTIEKILSGDYKEVNLEKLKGADIYSVRASRKARLLFATITHQGQKRLMLIAELPNHEYSKSILRLKKSQINFFIRNSAEKLTDTFESQPVEKIEGLEPQADKGRLIGAPLHHFNSFIELSKEQLGVMDCQLPQLLLGGPGSGKTAVQVAYLEKLCEQSPFHADAASAPRKILYVTQSKVLVDYVKKLCLSHPNLGNEVEAHIDFLSYKEFIEKHFSAEVKDKSLVGLTDFVGWFDKIFIPKERLKRRAIKTKSLPQIAARDAYQDLRIISAYGDKYLSAGQTQTLLSDKSSRALVFSAYQSYSAYLDQNKQYDLSFMMPKTERLYETCLLDEAQDLSLGQVMMLASSCQDNIVIASDNRQSLTHSWSNRELLVQLFREKHRTLTTTELSSLFRCPSNILDVANAVINLKCDYAGGFSDKKADGPVAAAPSCEGIEGAVKLITNDESDLYDSCQTFSKRADFAIITHTSFVEDAKRLFNTQLVFSFSASKGLEFNHILLYRPFDSGSFSTIHRALMSGADKCQSGAASASASSAAAHRPKDHNISGKFIPEFNMIFTAVTRAMRSLIIYQPDNHDTRLFVEKLRSGISAEQAPAPDEPESSLADWEHRAKDLYVRGLTKEAQAILQQYFKGDAAVLARVRGAAKEDEPPTSVDLSPTGILFNPRDKKQTLSAKADERILRSLLSRLSNRRKKISRDELEQLLFEARDTHALLFKYFIQTFGGKKRTDPKSLLAYLLEDNVSREAMLLMLREKSSSLMAVIAKPESFSMYKVSGRVIQSALLDCKIFTLDLLLQMISTAPEVAELLSQPDAVNVWTKKETQLKFFHNLMSS